MQTMLREKLLSHNLMGHTDVLVCKPIPGKEGCSIFIVKQCIWLSVVVEL